MSDRSVERPYGQVIEAATEALVSVAVEGIVGVGVGVTTLQGLVASVEKRRK